MIAALDGLSSRRVVLVGGKGGVGKTTIATAAALHYAKTRPAILFTTDPASNLGDLEVSQVRVEALDAESLYRRFLEQHLESFLEIGDRGTYLDREELRRLLELSLPGIDELMAWMHIGDLAEAHPQSMVVVDTAPTGHTLRMLSSSGHFRQMALALDAMQEKHRSMVRQFTRRDIRDAADQFIDDFHDRAQRRQALLLDPACTAFLPVMLSEPLVIEQTLRLIGELEIDVPFVILNRAIADPDCALDEARAERDAAARAALAPRRVVDASRSCAPLDTAEKIRAWSAGHGSAGSPPAGPPAARRHAAPLAPVIAPVTGPVIAPVTFLAGKGGVGKTSCASSLALQLAARNPALHYVIISVDPAHSLLDLFASESPPSNLSVETIDTKAKWRRFRDSLGREVDQAMDALTPRGISVAHDSEAMQRLIEIAPPGADELFAIARLAELAADETLGGVIVDTAPTGHFLRLLDLPRTAGEWVRELMRLLLRYREVLAPAALGEELVRASRSLKELDATLRSDRVTVMVVTRPERVVVAETQRLIHDVRGRGIHVGGVFANYVTPDNECACDRSLRAGELLLLEELRDVTLIGRRERPPASLAELATLLPLP